MSQAALVVHELMDSPENWTERADATITNGYYIVSLDALRYGMGSAMYQATGGESDTLRKAVQEWKEVTGWKEKAPGAVEPSPQDRSQARMTPDAYSKKAYQEFAFAIRKHHRSYKVHGDANVLSSGIEIAISALDALLRPVEAIERVKRNQEGGQSDNTSGS